VPNGYKSIYNSMLFRLYIGSNNTTHKLETEKAKKVVNRFFEGYTISKAEVLWKGQVEKSMMIDIETETLERITELSKELCKELEQQAVGVAQIGTMQFIS